MAPKNKVLAANKKIATESAKSSSVASIDDITRPITDTKDTRRLASTRAAKSFEDFLKDITNPDTGKKFTKVDETTGKVRGAKGDWAKYLNSKNIKVGSLAATDELNRLSKIRYVDIASAGKSFSEDIISAITGTQPGERGARDIRNATQEEIKQIKKVATQAEGANSTKAKQKLLTTLFEKSFPVLKQVPKYAALLSTAIASKAFGYMPIASPTSDPYAMKYEEREAEQKKQRLMEENNITQEQMNQIANQPMDLLAPRKNMGGIMNMDNMTAPLGYAQGGPAGKTEFEGRPYNEVLGRVMTKDEMRTDYAAPPPDPRDPDDLDMVINQMTFHVLHDKDRPMKENITRENYFKLTNEESKGIADQLAVQLGISSDSPEYENIRAKIMEQGEMINKIREKKAQPSSTKILNFLKDKIGMASGGIVGIR